MSCRTVDFANHIHHESLCMLIRKIPKNVLIDPFESLLEKEFMALLNFDDALDKLQNQPGRAGFNAAC